LPLGAAFDRRIQEDLGPSSTRRLPCARPRSARTVAVIANRAVSPCSASTTRNTPGDRMWAHFPLRPQLEFQHLRRRAPRAKRRVLKHHWRCIGAVSRKGRTLCRRPTSSRQCAPCPPERNARERPLGGDLPSTSVSRRHRLGRSGRVARGGSITCPQYLHPLLLKAPPVAGRPNGDRQAILAIRSEGRTNCSQRLGAHGTAATHVPPRIGRRNRDNRDANHQSWTPIWPAWPAWPIWPFDFRGTCRGSGLQGSSILTRDAGRPGCVHSTQNAGFSIETVRLPWSESVAWPVCAEPDDSSAVHMGGRRFARRTSGVLRPAIPEGKGMTEYRALTRCARRHGPHSP
jgi:hypothetical protein